MAYKGEDVKCDVMWFQVSICRVIGAYETLGINLSNCTEPCPNVWHYLHELPLESQTKGFQSKA